MIWKFWPKPFWKPARHAKLDSDGLGPERLCKRAACEHPEHLVDNRAVLSVKAPTFFIARAWARGHFLTDELHDEPLPDDEDADVEIAWEGSDSGSRGGTPDGLHLMAREVLGVGVWERAQV
jgi:hypothetical protein